MYELFFHLENFKRPGIQIVFRNPWFNQQNVYDVKPQNLMGHKLFHYILLN